MLIAEGEPSTLPVTRPSESNVTVVAVEGMHDQLRLG